MGFLWWHINEIYSSLKCSIQNDSKAAVCYYASILHHAALSWSVKYHEVCLWGKAFLSPLFAAIKTQKTKKWFTDHNKLASFLMHCVFVVTFFPNFTDEWCLKALSGAMKRLCYSDTVAETGGESPTWALKLRSIYYLLLLPATAGFSGCQTANGFKTHLLETLLKHKWRFPYFLNSAAANMLFWGFTRSPPTLCLNVLSMFTKQWLQLYKLHKTFFKRLF